jgi:hypothetical protein
MADLSIHTGVDRHAEVMIFRKRAPQAPAGSREGLSPLSSEKNRCTSRIRAAWLRTAG